MWGNPHITKMWTIYFEIIIKGEMFFFYWTLPLLILQNTVKTKYFDRFLSPLLPKNVFLSYTTVYGSVFCTLMPRTGLSMYTYTVISTTIMRELQISTCKLLNRCWAGFYFTKFVLLVAEGCSRSSGFYKTLIFFNSRFSKLVSGFHKTLNFFLQN